MRAPESVDSTSHAAQPRSVRPAPPPSPRSKTARTTSQTATRPRAGRPTAERVTSNNALRIARREYQQRRRDIPSSYRDPTVDTLAGFVADPHHSRGERIAVAVLLVTLTRAERAAWRAHLNGGTTR